MQDGECCILTNRQLKICVCIVDGIVSVGDALYVEKNSYDQSSYFSFHTNDLNATAFDILGNKLTNQSNVCMK